MLKSFIVSLILTIGIATVAALVVAGICAISGTLAYMALVFSRSAFALILAYPLSISYPLIESGSSIENLLLWLGIFAGVIFIFSLLPKVNNALQFLCTTFIAYLVVFLFGFIVLGLAQSIMGEDIKYMPFFEILFKIICLIVSIRVLTPKVAKKTSFGIKSSNFIIVLMQRILASGIYGFTIMIMFAFNSPWPLSILAQWCIWGVGFILTFIVDVFFSNLIENIVKKTNEKIEQEKERRDAAREKNDSILQSQYGDPLYCDNPYIKPISKNKCARCGDRLNFFTRMDYEDAYYCYFCIRQLKYEKRTQTFRGKVFDVLNDFVFQIDEDDLD